jgi:hypothetical protein
MDKKPEKVRDGWLLIMFLLLFLLTLIATFPGWHDFVSVR